MAPRPLDAWETVASTLAAATIVGLVLAEQFHILPGAVVALLAAWWISRLSGWTLRTVVARRADTPVPWSGAAPRPVAPPDRL